MDSSGLVYPHLVRPELAFKSPVSFGTTLETQGLTLAGVCVASLCWSPGKVMVEVLALFTVQSFSVVVTHAVTMNLKDLQIIDQ